MACSDETGDVACCSVQVRFGWVTDTAIGLLSSKSGHCQDINVKVYLDDERMTPVGWVRVYWPDEAVKLLSTGQVSELSLDHDLGNDEHGTGYDVVLWIEEAVALRGFDPPLIRVHSANSSAREKMEAGIAAITRLHAARR